jgi:hypothetical protein
MMKKNTFIRTPTFVWILMLILLVSSMIGTTVGAKSGKPDNPGKPKPSPPETATFRIWIGAEGENVALTSPDYFDVVTTDEGWYPKAKGKPRSGLWKIPWEIPLGEERTGSYVMQPIYSEANGTVLTDFYHDEPAQLVELHHHWGRWEDYWHIGINWTSDIDNDGKLDPLILIGSTDRGPELEGSYNAASDMWTVTFTATNADFGVGWCDDAACWLYWYGNLEFTVIIQKNPSS